MAIVNIYVVYHVPSTLLSFFFWRRNCRLNPGALDGLSYLAYERVTAKKLM